MTSTTLAASSATLATVTTGKTWIVKELILCNKSATDQVVTITFNGKTIFADTIKAGKTVVIKLSTVLSASQIIAGFAGAASSVDCTISGVEV
jgi:hypothetical protein